ncbi:nitric-oxide reductase large subunit [Actinomadura syzygii]|uniref:Nitric-oxide reductase large subunit n=1 Tax=Actinomadura syzygii TaxID=1427538 RepID=A0A5D0UF30_9ACTN|nr:cbb3-type cytochrome c oxidase subunit I [Actinomadura syzygii]TYC16380.1 nitric-oxide reductase large subunit [Actinomadura syzygii]
MDSSAVTTPRRRDRLIGRGWIQAAALVILFGFFVLVLMGYQTYQSGPPIPERTVTPSGQTVYTRADVKAGQGVFLKNGLMEYGSIFGHGAYLGPDFTADYLHRSAELVNKTYGGTGSGSAAQRTIDDYRVNKYDARTRTLTISDAQAEAFTTMTAYYARFFASPQGKTGLRPKAITDPTQIRQLTGYFAWSAWAAAAQRPGEKYSYTNNWPSEPLVGNKPTADTVLWSAVSLIALLGGTGALFAAFGRWNWLGWHGRDRQELRFREPGSVGLTPSQRTTAWFFFAVVGLFLLQTIVGAASQHYRADLGSFFGIPLDRWLPYNLVRTWHVQLALFWVATSFLAAGIFLVPMITRRRDPKWQAGLAYALLGALVVVVVGSMLGELAGMRGAFGELWSWLGMQGFEYLDLGRLWQILLTIGMAFWVVLLWRGLRHKLATESRANLPWLFFFAALALPVVYATGLLARHDSSFTVTDFWRFMVVHLWVEDFLELFTTVMVAYIFVLLGVVREHIALRVVFLDIVLYSAGGVIGTAHHWYFNGEPASVLALGAFFSAFEVIPLTFLTIEAWTFIRLGARQESKSAAAFPHRWAVMFLVAVGFWNFLGAGVFGFLINLPVVSYFEMGTSLTANHGHAAMMGVYGMLAVGFAMFALRYLVPARRWSDRAAAVSFWSLNAGLAWMVFVTLLPLGLLQLYRSADVGYFDARSLSFVSDSTNTVFEWLRLPGDVVFIVGGIGPLLWLAWLGVRHRGRHAAPLGAGPPASAETPAPAGAVEHGSTGAAAPVEQELVLFTEVVPPAEGVRPAD